MSSNDFREQIIRDFIREALPTIYLEGFNETLKNQGLVSFQKKRFDLLA